MSVKTPPVPVFFRLKDASEYRFYNRAGQRQLNVKKGQVIEAVSKEDQDYFSARGDVLVKCDAKGVSLEDLEKKGHLEPGKPKSFRVFGRASSAQQTGPQVSGPTVAPPQVQQVVAPVPTTTPKPTTASQPVENPPAPRSTRKPRGGKGNLTRDASGQAVPGQPFSALAQLGEESPIEEARTDGTTVQIQTDQI